MENFKTEAAGFLAWAKRQPNARFNLAGSGVQECPLSELPVRMEDLEIAGPDSYGYEPLMQRLAAKTGAPRACVVYTLGTAMASFVALTALVQRGDEVLVERPAYDPMLAVLDHIGAKISRFERRPEKGFRLGLGEVERRITPATKLIVLCNLHNPSSAFTDEDTLRQLGEMAAKVGARVLVDEVYLETLFDRPWRSSFHLGPNFVVTSSLAKGYGLAGLRCGWILAQPELVQRMWEIVDFTYVTPVHLAERVAVIALDNLEPLRRRARRLLETNRALLNEFLAAHPAISCEASRYGTTVFPCLRNGNASEFVKLLRERFETSVVPGDFFEHPQHFRLGFGGETEMLRGGLERMAAALDAFGKVS